MAPNRGATLFSSLGKVKEDGLAGGGGSLGSLLDYYAISCRAPKSTPSVFDDERRPERDKRLLGIVVGDDQRSRQIRHLLGVINNEWQSRRVRRFYQRFYAGVGVGGRLRILTLTTSDEALALGLDMHKAFLALVKRLRRRFGRFEYIGVKEVKGDRVHLHLVFQGVYMDQVVVSAMWQSIYRSKVVDIRAVYKARGGVRYLAKYLAKGKLNRYWVSYNWVFRGWVGWSRRFCKVVGHYPSKALLGVLARLDTSKRCEVMRALCPAAMGPT